MGKIIVVAVIIGLGAYVFMQKTAAPASDMTESSRSGAASEQAASGPVKEFSMTAYYDAQGKWYSLKDISVKKGDRVRIKVTNTAGMHDFVLDEFGVKQELPLNQEMVIDFVADKVGAFQYYCSKPGHRAGGQWGTLTVSE
ncbi:MAG: cupredoxin domain-containing protein [Candidatus Moranbacteria bacterium]|nr:cupredoxin domain-containing protein [Candidatus Moranbacteria bacterium]MBP6033894.1 cupredoxin domain-containing protein [Candidatus Moranbacteria bacterium]MBP7695647.1 cupredoxin domain-containing protein [Candidatus Moranbacteria bacterium]